MKRNIFIFSFTIAIFSFLLILGFTSLSSDTKSGGTEVFPPSNNNGNGFLISSLDIGAYNDYQYSSDTLGFNFWHKYPAVSEFMGGRHYPKGWINNGAPGDTLFAGYNDYVSQVKGVMENVNSHNGMKVLLQRPKIEYLCGACPALDAGGREAVTGALIKQM